MKGEECAAVDYFINNETFWKFYLLNKFKASNFIQPIDKFIKKKVKFIKSLACWMVYIILP